MPGLDGGAEAGCNPSECWDRGIGELGSSGMLWEPLGWLTVVAEVPGDGPVTS